jgi:hypothetical protein
MPEAGFGVSTILPVVSAFFELGREPIATFRRGLRSLRLDEMAGHADLQSAEPAVACPKAIDGHRNVRATPKMPCLPLWMARGIVLWAM